VDTALGNADEIIAEYIKWMESRGYSEATMRYYRLHVAHFLRYQKTVAQKINDLKQADRDLVASYKKLMQENQFMYAEAVSEQCHYALSNFFKWLKEINAIENNPLEIIKPPLEGPRDFFTEEEMKKIMSAHDTSTNLGKRNRAMIEVLYYLGIRNRELIGLKVGHFNFDHGCVNIPGVFERKLFLNEAFDSLEHYSVFVRPWLPGHEKSPWFFIKNWGMQMEASDVLEVVQEYATRAGINAKVKPLTIRNSMALHALYRGSTAHEVQIILGDKDLETTEKMFLKLGATHSSLKDIEDYL